MTIDEAILLERETVRRNKMMLELNKLMQESHAVCFDKLKRETSIRIHEQLAEWLEELKELRELNQKNPFLVDMIKHDSIVRNKAIDDFVKAIVDRGLSANDDKYCITHYDNYLKVIKELAEQLKAGVKYEM